MVDDREIFVQTQDLTLSVIIPVYNEARTVAALIERVRAIPLRTEIVCVDDASTDGSRDVRERLKEQGRIDRLVFQDRNRGKGAAVRRSIQEATGDAIVIQDADMEYDPQHLIELITPIAARWEERR